MRLHARLLLCSTLLASGCAGGHDATEKELAELRAEVTKLRAAQSALGERVDNLEIDRGAFGKGAATAAPSAGPPPAPADRPELSVVRLSPSEGDGDADNGSARPMIRAVGGDGSIHKSKPKDAAKKGAAPASRPTVKP